MRTEPYIYVDEIKVYQELPEKMKVLVNKIKILIIQKEVWKKQAGMLTSRPEQRQIVDDYNFIKWKIDELREEYEEENEEFG